MNFSGSCIIFPSHFYFALKYLHVLYILPDWGSRDYIQAEGITLLLHCVISDQFFFSYFPTLRGCLTSLNSDTQCSKTQTQIYLSYHIPSPFYHSTKSSKIPLSLTSNRLFKIAFPANTKRPFRERQVLSVPSTAIYLGMVPSAWRWRICHQGKLG